MTTTINNEQKKLNVPNLRFKEFQGEWEEKRLSEIAELYKGNGISKEQLSDRGEPCILYGELYTKYKSEVISEVVSKTNIDTKKLVRSKANDVIIPCSGETAEDIATARCVPYDNILLGGDLNIIRLHDTEGSFMSYQLNGKRKYDIAKVAQGVSVVHLYGEHLKGVKTYVPCVEEQKKIARLLSLLDERIATQSKVIEDLKKLKCAIIEKHYRQAKLHKYKICDLGVPFSVGSLSKEDLSEKGHECILYGELFTTYDCVINEIKSHTNKIANMTLSQKRDLLFPSSTTVDAVSLISPSVIDIPNVVLGGDMFGIHIDKKFNAYYLSYYINIIARKKLAIYAKGSTIIHLHYKDIAKAQLLLPDLCEQDRIAKCMMAEDDKIKVEEQLMTKLEEQKQYLLRQMFI